MEPVPSRDERVRERRAGAVELVDEEEAREDVVP